MLFVVRWLLAVVVSLEVDILVCVGCRLLFVGWGCVLCVAAMCLQIVVRCVLIVCCLLFDVG